MTVRSGGGRRRVAPFPSTHHANSHEPRRARQAAVQHSQSPPATSTLVNQSRPRPRCSLGLAQRTCQAGAEAAVLLGLALPRRALDSGPRPSMSLRGPRRRPPRTVQNSKGRCSASRAQARRAGYQTCQEAGSAMVGEEEKGEACPYCQSPSHWQSQGGLVTDTAAQGAQPAAWWSWEQRREPWSARWRSCA